VWALSVSSLLLITVLLPLTCLNHMANRLSSSRNGDSFRHFLWPENLPLNTWNLQSLIIRIKSHLLLQRFGDHRKHSATQLARPWSYRVVSVHEGNKGDTYIHSS
jgi:hypothetical protein